MISEEEINVWWERKIENYIKIMLDETNFNLTQAKAKFFMETHEKFLKSIPQAIQNLLKNNS